MSQSRVINVFWVASYPKSGNTWINSIIRHLGLISGSYQGTPLDAYDLIRQGLQPTPFPSLLHRDACLLKTHASFRRREMHAGAFDLPLETVGFIHIYRNPLDVLLSYINFSRIQYERMASRGGPIKRYGNRLFGGLLGMTERPTPEQWRNSGLDSIPRENLDHALKVFAENDLVIETIGPLSGSWLENARSWIAGAEQVPGTTLRYEDCLADPGRLAAIARHFDFDEAAVMDANRTVSAQSSQAKRGNPREDSIFFNKMSAYYFEEYFSPNAVRAFLEQYGAPLRELGYDALVDHYV